MSFKPDPARILVVDDDSQERLAVSRIVSSLGYAVETASEGEEALERLGTTPIDVIVTDLMMPGMDGFQLLKTLHERGDVTPSIVLTGVSSIEKAVSIVHDLHAFWFLEKPAQVSVLGPLLERALRNKKLISETERLQRQLGNRGVLRDMVGTSQSMRQLFSLIEQVAPTSASVLIVGESGTGKERVAAAIHELSPRAAGPFVAINCAAIPESLMESELFGHEKGSFTGAVARRGGCFEHAHQGTLFLDEIGEMPPQMQAKLLRVLEDSKVRRLGGDREISVDVRIVAATNRPIQEAISKNLLREDLYYRLNVFHIDLPPLRHRKEDIPILAEALIRNINQKNDCRVTDLHADAQARLMNHVWPGNVRELRNVLERAVIVAREGTILSKHLPPGFGVPETERSANPPPAAHGSITFQPGLSLSEVDKAYIKLTLERTKNKKEAARILGISLRTLQSRVSEMMVEESGQPSRGSEDVRFLT